jgi:hypothetical protein
MNRSRVVLLAVCSICFLAIAAVRQDSSVIALRFVPADEAFTALKEHLGSDHAAVVTSVDVRTNALKLDEQHAQAAKARAFLAAFDARPAQVRVDAVISRHVRATATQEAHDTVLSRPTSIVREGDRVVFSVPGADGETKIELRIHSIPAQK